MNKTKLKYDITKNAAPKMPKLGKGTECVQLLLSQERSWLPIGGAPRRGEGAT